MKIGGKFLISFFSKYYLPSSAGRLDAARRAYAVRVEFKRLLADIFQVALGITAAAFGLKGLLLPNHFLDGGATGISLLISQVSDISLPVLLLLVNLPFILIGYRTISPAFAIRSAIAIIGLALTINFIDFPEITKDKLLVSVFGGFFLGAGIGLAVRGGSVLDGTEVLAIALSKRFGLSIGDIILVINIIIFSTAAWLLSIETALYAILTYMAASKTVDFILEGIEEYTAVTIVSVKAQPIGMMIREKLGRGYTVLKGEKGFGRSGEQVYEMQVLYSIVTRLEVSRLKTEIEKIDPNAFVVMTSVKDMKGGMIKKRRHKQLTKHLK